MLLNYCLLHKDYYIKILYFLHLSLCLRLGLFLSYLCDLFYSIIIFILVTTNHIISLKQTSFELLAI